MPRTTQESTFPARIGEAGESRKKSGAPAGLRSKNGVFTFIGKLENSRGPTNSRKGQLPAPAFENPAQVLGTVEAGFPSPAEEELVDTLSLDEFLIRNREATFLLKVSGDSMTGAGILPGDMVIVDKGRTAKSGDIVIAQVDGEWTMKFLRKRGDSVTLVPANPRYQPIRPKNELNVAGVVTAVVRKYK